MTITFLSPAAARARFERVEDAAGDELEGGVAFDDGFVWAVGDDEDGDAGAGVVAPAADDVVHAAADDPGADQR